jgi:hypothetical protein
MAQRKFYRHKKKPAAQAQSSAQPAQAALNSAALKISVRDLKLSAPTLELLEKNNIKNAAELCMRTEKDMYKIQNLNKRILTEIAFALKRHNLAFRMLETRVTAPQAAKQSGVKKINEKPEAATEIEFDLKPSKKKDFLSTRSTDKQPARETRRQPELPITKPLPPSEWRKVQRGGKWGFSDGIRTVISPMYDEVHSFHEGLACVEVDERCGFIDTENNMVIPVQYDGALSFAEGLAVVFSGGKCGYINPENEIVFPCVYDAATPFEDGVARVKQMGRWGFLSKDGNIRWK